MMAVLGFILSPAGRIVVIGIAVLMAVAFIDRRATYRERAKCNARAIQSQLDTARADLKAAKDAHQRDLDATAELEKEKDTANAEAKRLAELVEKLPADKRCTFDGRPGGVRERR